MSDAMMASVLALVGTLVGSFGGIIAANRLTNWRIEQLEKKVDKHNSVIERMVVAERDICQLRTDVDDLKGE